MNMIMLLTAGQNLFDSAWTEGNLYEIQGVVNVLGTLSCWVISAVGFGIVIFSILKNALSGLYVVNPRFWDRVSDIKTEVTGGMSSGINELTKGNAAASKLGSVLTWVLSHIPNLKDLTDFADDSDSTSIDKKQYFARSLPILLAQIFIGTLIFQGYPTKIAAWINDGSTHVLDAVLNNVDPVEFVEDISDSFKVYALTTDGSQDPWEKAINKMSAEMMGVVNTRYSDMKGEPAQQTAYYIESQLISAFDISTVKEVLGAKEGYNISISTQSYPGVPTPSSSYQNIGNGVYMAQATNGTISYMYWIQGTVLPTGVTNVDSNDYFVWRITATPEAVSNVSTSNLIVFGGISNIPTVSADGITITVKGITVGSADSDIKGTLGRNVIVNIVDASTGSTLQTLNATLSSPSVQMTNNATPLLVFDNSARDSLATAMAVGSNCYLQVQLTGDWSKTWTDGKSSTSLNILEWRLTPGETGISYALSSWGGVDGTVTKGVDIHGGNISRMMQVTEVTNTNGTISVE